MQAQDGWLSHLRVLDLTDQRGQLAGQMLARLGADVLLVEPPQGSPARRAGPFDAAGRSLFWSAYAAGKRATVLDIAADRAAFDDLVRSADILIESAGPSGRAALGLDYARLGLVNPALVHVSISPFGSTGSRQDDRDSDLTLWAAGGALEPNRDANGVPLRISVPQSYLHASADAVSGALIAWFARNITGRGQHVDISVQQSVTQATLSSIMASALGHPGFTARAAVPKPGGRKQVDLSGSGARTRRSKWAVADGLVEMHLSMGPTTGGRTNRLFAWMRDVNALPERFHDWDWVTVPDRIVSGELDEDTIEEVRACVAALFARYTKSELGDIAVARQFMLAPINEIPDLLASRHLANRGFFVTVHEDGAERIMPGAFAAGVPGMFAAPRPAPALGQDAPQFGARLQQDARRPDVARPLGDLKVLDLAWVVAGPAIGRVLADYGAQVVRVESSVRIDTARMMGPFPGGTIDRERSALFETYNAGKLGVTIDLASEAGRAILWDLIRWADILVESFAPGQMRRWGMAPDAIHAVNPGLIGLSTSLMGQTGPYAGFAGFGGLGAAVAGFQALVGQPGALPVGPFGPYTDFVAPRFALPALLTAVERRRRTGEGCWLDIAQAEAGIQFLAAEVAATAATGAAPRAQGNRDPAFAPHGVYRCMGDDVWIALAVQSDAEWGAFAERIGGAARDPRYATVAGRKAHEDDLDALVAAWIGGRSAADAEAELLRLGIAAHKAATGADLLNGSLAERGHFVWLPHPLGGETVVDASRYALSDTPALYRRAAPSLGQDNAGVLGSLLGYPPERIAQLEAEGVLR